MKDQYYYLVGIGSALLTKIAWDWLSNKKQPATVSIDTFDKLKADVVSVSSTLSTCKARHEERYDTIQKNLERDSESFKAIHEEVKEIRENMIKVLMYMEQNNESK